MSLRIYKGEAVTASPVSTPESAKALGFEIDFYNWLPYAAPAYNISPRREDYAMFAVPIHGSDLPNRNGYAFPLVELLKWSPDFGCQAYMTWRGKPMFVEHKSEDIKTAIGVIADVSLRQIKGFGNDKFWKVMALVALDRTKNTELVRKIESKEVNTYSMGAMVDHWSCSYCGAVGGKCSHIDPARPVTMYELDNQLVYKNVHGIKGYELSQVGDPACPASISDAEIKLSTAS